MKKLLLFFAGMMMAGSAVAQEEVVREQPEGTLRTFHGYSLATALNWLYVTEDVHDGLAREVVFSDNGDVWFKNPISKINTNSWIKGTLKDGVITVELPQLIDVEESDGEVIKWYAQRYIGTTVYDEENDEEEIEWNFDPEKTSITYTFRNDSIIQDEKMVKLGLMENGKNMYYGDRDVVYTAVDEHSVKMPEGIEPETWSLKYNSVYATQVKVAMDGDDMYIQGFWSEFPQAVMKGRIEGDKAIIHSQQYLGFLKSGENGYYTYLMNSKIIPGLVDGYITTDEPIAFRYDAESKIMTAYDNMSALIVHYGKTKGVEEYAYNVRLSLKDPYLAKIYEIGELYTPEITRVNRDYEYAWGYIEATVLAEDNLGNALDVNQLTYCMWLDDEKNLFDPALDFNGQFKYRNLPEPTYDLPYTFDNNSGISINGSPANKYLQFFELGFDEIGIQATYYDELSERTLRSDIMYINPETKETRVVKDPMTGVGNVVDGNAEIAEISFYDLNGCRLAAPANGIYVKVIRYTDGTSKAFKKIGR